MSMHTHTTLQAILFDLDGVLVDSRGPITSCINHALEREGLAPFPVEALYRCIGPPLLPSFARLLEERGADASRASACVEHYRERYRVIAATSTPAFEGIEACVQRLANRFPLVVATSKPTVFAEAILAGVGIDGHFQAIVGPSLDHTHHESKTETVGRALAELGLSSGAAAAMIGDTHFDMEAGRHHGLLTIGVGWGIGDEQELRQAGAHEVVPDPANLATGLLKRSPATPG